MAKKLSYVQTAVSVPADLKKRMAAHKGAVNWSAVACQAFQRKLEELATQKEESDMTDILKRLKLSKRAYQGETMTQGIEAGKNWATKTAEFKQLANLATANAEFAADSSLGDFKGWVQSFGGNDAFRPGERLAEVIEGEGLDRRSMEDFWEVAIGEESAEQIHNYDFVIGFNQGAMEVWDQVKDQL